MKISLNPKAKDAATRDALVAEGGFGKYYTDHMGLGSPQSRTSCLRKRKNKYENSNSLIPLVFSLCLSQKHS